ncbi:MAG: DNA polymerase III subunit delta [Ignavibacteriaceae bacterium]
MAKSKLSFPSVSEAVKSIKRGNLLPIYFFFGEDSFSIDTSVSALSEAVKPHIASEFDKETFYGDEKPLSDIIDFASAFPFGSEKKFIIYKEFEKVRDKKNLRPYIESPSDFTVLLIIHNGSIQNPDTVFYRTLLENGFIFEAKELKGKNLINWLIDYCEANKKTLGPENAQILVDIVGENRSMLEAQLDKIFTFIGDKPEIILDDIRTLSSELKEYSIFDLQDAIARKDKARAMKLAFNLLEKGQEPTFIIHMLTRYFTGLARVNEMTELKMNEYAAARIVGTHPYYYKGYKLARRAYSDKDLFQASRALLKADLAIKTTSADNKSIVSVLISEMFN